MVRNLAARFCEASSLQDWTLTLNVLNCFKDYKRLIHILNHILIWLGPSRWNSLWNNNTVETLYSTIYYSKYFIELNFDKSTQYLALWTHKRHPYLALSGELWSVFYEYFNRNWSCYKGFLLYMMSVLCSQYHACWWSGDFRSQGISRHGIDPQSRNIPSPASEELQWLYHSEIWQTPRQHCCRGVCQISEWWDDKLLSCNWAFTISGCGTTYSLVNRAPNSILHNHPYLVFFLS